MGHGSHDQDFHCPKSQSPEWSTADPRCWLLTPSSGVHYSPWSSSGSRHQSPSAAHFSPPKISCSQKIRLAIPFELWRGGVNILSSLALRDDTLHLVQPTIRTRSAMLYNIAPHLSRPTALACLGRTPLYRPKTRHWGISRGRCAPLDPRRCRCLRRGSPRRRISHCYSSRMLQELKSDARLIRVRILSSIKPKEMCRRSCGEPEIVGEQVGVTSSRA